MAKKITISASDLGELQDALSALEATVGSVYLIIDQIIANAQAEAEGDDDDDRGDPGPPPPPPGGP